MSCCAQASARRPDPVGLRYAEGSVEVTTWLGAVDEATRRIDAGELDKVVLARDIVAHLDEPLDVRHVLTRLSSSYPECWTFCVDGMVGATPELLVRRSGESVTSRVLAGTVRRSWKAPGSDAELATSLLESAKDHEEHAYAVASVAAALAAHCTDLSVPPSPRLLALANVQHLATDVTGSLADGATVLGLAASLHPTAAVCGTPTERAFALIRSLEGMSRGRYAGPVGWLAALRRRGAGHRAALRRCRRRRAVGAAVRRLRHRRGLLARGRARRVAGQARACATRWSPPSGRRPAVGVRRPAFGVRRPGRRRSAVGAQRPALTSCAPSVGNRVHLEVCAGALHRLRGGGRGG